MLPRKGFDTHERWGKHQCCVFMVVNSSGAVVCAVPHVPFEEFSPLLLELGSCHHVCSRNKGVKVQELGLPPPPEKG